MKKLLSEYTLGDISLKNRVVMAPMTRSRCPGNVPGELVATYYGQRTEAGLIITEGTSPSPNGLGYARIPGAFNTAQTEGWKRVAQAVHQKGSRIFMQLMHTGRVGHPLNLPEGARILAPSAIVAPGEMFTDQEGMQPHPVPEPMTAQQIEDTINEYVQAAANAVDRAGFDGVELHGANGYLIEQFLNIATNQRGDDWGGSVQGRAKFAVEVARAVAEKIGPRRTGIRLSPYGVFNGTLSDDKTDELFLYLAKALSELGIVYIHLVDHSSMGAPPVSEQLKKQIRQTFKGTLVLSGGYDAKRAEADLIADNGDLVAFGRPFISNPRLVTSLKDGRQLIEANMKTFYTPGPEGYIDYPL